VGLNYEYEKWCVLSTNQIINLNLNLYMVNNGLIRLAELTDGDDGGIAAKWVLQIESSGFTTIRLTLDQTYAVTVNKEKNSVELKPFVEGNIDQEWTFHSN